MPVEFLGLYGWIIYKFDDNCDKVSEIDGIASEKMSIELN
jgi:hypothetical protein